jgi:hypothetical protein
MTLPEAPVSHDLAATGEAARVYRLRPDIVKVERRDLIILVSTKDGKSVRVSPAARTLLPLLAEGAPFDGLLARLRDSHPDQAGIPRKLQAFLEQIGGTGLLDDGSCAPRRTLRTPCVVLLHPDRAMAHLAVLVRRAPAWLGWACLALALLAAIGGIAALVMSGRLPHPRELVSGFDPWALLLFALVVVPIHEASHALVCRLAGASVGSAGIVFHGWLVPGPYVETTQAYRVRERWKRFWIPAAGPVVDFISCGVAAWVVVVATSDQTQLSSTAIWLFLISAVFVYLDTNPLTPSDGSHMLEAVLDDELARRSALGLRSRARLSHWKTVAWYRMASSIHAQSSLLLAYFWWT